MKKLLLFFGLGTVLFLASSCASIVSKSSYPVSITSYPSGANYILRDKDSQVVIASGVTPATHTLEASDGFFSKAKYTVEFKKDGYTPVSVPLHGQISGWYLAGNFFFGGPIGWIVIDPATGCMWKLPKLVSGNLQPLPVAPKPSLVPPNAEPAAKPIL